MGKVQHQMLPEDPGRLSSKYRGWVVCLTIQEKRWSMRYGVAPALRHGENGQIDAQVEPSPSYPVLSGLLLLFSLLCC